MSIPQRAVALVTASTIGVLAATGVAHAVRDADTGRTTDIQPATTTSSSWVPAPTPTDLRAVDATASSVTVAWEEPDGANEFRLDIADNSSMTDVRSKWTRYSQVTLSGLEPGTSYWVRVRVTEMEGENHRGPFTSPVEVGTIGAADPAPAPRPEPAPEPAPEPTPEPAPEPAPAPAPSGSTLFGANYSTTSAVDERVYEDRAEIARIFFQQLDTAQFSRNGAVQEALADGVDTFSISWKETDQTAIKNFLAGIPNGLTVYTTYHHEPEDDHGKPGDAAYKTWSEQYKRNWVAQAPLMRAEGFIPTSILMEWTLDSRSGRNVADWTPPKGTVDVFAFDAYYGSNQNAETQVDRMEAATRAAGATRTGIAETGAAVSYAPRVEKTKAMKAAVLASGMFDWAIYWNDTTGSYDARMDAATADAWFD